MPKMHTNANSVEAVEKKSCATCLAVLPYSEFYSKGNRIDSACKKCKKLKSKATYLRKRNVSSAAGIMGFIDIMAELQLKQVKTLRQRIRETLLERNLNINV